jgi:non-ribosomal peptide synthetase component F
VWQLPLEDAADELLPRVNATAADYPRGQCLHELVEAQAARTPAARAVEWKEDALSYAELLACAGRVAEWLRDAGVVADAVVALQMARGLEMGVAMLGVLRAGGAYCPLDPAWPATRRRFIVEDVACRQAVAQRAFEADWA